MDPDPYLSVIANGSCITFLPLTVESVVFIAIIVLLLVVSGLISSSEAAFFSLSSDDLKSLEGNRKSKRVFELLQAPDKLLATILIVNNLVNVAIAVLSAYTIFSIVDFSGSPVWGYILQVTFIVLILLIFGEVGPKIHASQNALKVSLRMAYPLSMFQKTFNPLVTMFVSSVLFVRKRSQKKQGISIEAISSALEMASESNTENENILKGIVKFGNIDVHTIMTPRTDVESVDSSIKLSELLALINESGYSRIPVYDDTPDNIKGILYVKDLLPYIEESDNFQWQRLIRDAYFVPEHKKIDDLLKEFQEMKMHMAVIIDEYGGMVGIVTLEDILEEIVGDIADESDDDEPDYVKINDNTYLFDGKVLLNNFFRTLRLDEADFEDIRGEADTLAGIILEIRGEIPQKGDCVDYDHMTFCIESVDNRRIKQIKVIINERDEK